MRLVENMIIWMVNKMKSWNFTWLKVEFGVAHWLLDLELVKHDKAELTTASDFSCFSCKISMKDKKGGGVEEAKYRFRIQDAQGGKYK